VAGGRYAAPTAPGASSQFRPESVAEFTFPSGPAWQPGGRPA
jgi:L-fuconate dehydratase